MTAIVLDKEERSGVSERTTTADRSHDSEASDQAASDHSGVSPNRFRRLRVLMDARRAWVALSGSTLIEPV